MTATTYTATTDWSSTNRLTALSATDVLISYPNITGAGAIAFSTTMGDFTPSITTADAAKVFPGGNIGIRLDAGERLWLATNGVASATVTLET